MDTTPNPIAAYPDMIELLVGGGEIGRRYVIDAHRHDPVEMEALSALVEGMLDAPQARRHSPSGSGSRWWLELGLSPRLAHPDLEDGTWLCLYAQRRDPEPVYVGVVTRAWWPEERLRRYAQILVAASAGDASDEGAVDRLVSEMRLADTLTGAYWPGYLEGRLRPMAQWEAAMDAMNVGKWAAMIGQCLLS